MDFQKLLVKIAKILDELKIPYAVTGGYAASVWGRMRTTLDIDVIIEVAGLRLDQLKKVLKRKFKISYVEPGSRSFNFIDGETGLKFDFFVVDKLDKTKKVIISGYKVSFIIPEDLIINKLVWQKETGSEQQLKDVEGILKSSKIKLDIDYLKERAKKLGISEILKKFL